MSMSGWSVVGQGILGAVMGGSKAAAQNADTEIKTKVLQQREEFLSKLRMGEYGKKLELEDQRKRRDEAETAAFYERTGPQTKDAETFTDTLGDEATGAAAGGIINEARTETRREVAERRLEQARRTGKKTLIDQVYGESKDIRAEEEQSRKSRVDETRTEAAARLAADREHRTEIQERMAAAREQVAATGQARLEAMIAGLIGKSKSDLPERKYDAKMWSEAKKELGADLVVDDPIAGKSKPDHTARYWATHTMRRLQGAGDVDPADAATLVGEMVSKVRQSAFTAARGDNALYQKFFAAGMQAETKRLFEKAGGEPRPTIKDPFASINPFASIKVDKPGAPQKAKPQGVIASEAAKPQQQDPMLAKVEEETRAIERGKMKDYSPEVKMWMQEHSAESRKKFRAGDDDFLKREQERMLRGPMR